VLQVPLTHDHLSVISGITLDGRLFLQMQEQTYTAETVVGFLRVLLRKMRGKVLVVWDGSPIHKGQPIKDFLAQGAAKRLHLERLPGYAPDLNPDEGIWNSLNRAELKNCCCRDLVQLRLELRRATERLRHKRHIIQGYSYQCGYAGESPLSISGGQPIEGNDVHWPRRTSSVGDHRGGAMHA
jgi:transposase